MSLPTAPRLISLSLEKIHSNRLEICKICDDCGEKFLAKRDYACFCSRLCYRRYIRKNPTPRKRDSANKLEYWGSSAGRASYRRVAHKIELRKAIRKMVGTQVRSKTDVISLYQELVKAVHKNKRKARKVLEGGFPDAAKLFVEFKFGLDGLRSNQLILDILHGCKGKVRWIPSYDSLENSLRGGENQSILFKSYLKYLMACDKTRTLDFK